MIFIKLFESYFDVSVPAAMKRMGWEVEEETFYTPEDFVHDARLQQMVRERLKGEKCDFVFTVNFWPVLAPVLDDLGMKYVSWSYDAPLRLAGTDEMERDNNFIFLFDRGQVQEYQNQGVTRVFHLPLGVDIPAFEKALSKKSSHHYGISFIGSFYASPYVPILSAMDDYLRGLLQGTLNAQKNLIGYYILPELITDDIAKQVDDRLIFVKNNPSGFSPNAVEAANDFAGQVSRQNLIFTMATRITCLDRLTLVAAAARVTDTFVCTGDTESLKKTLPDVTVHGHVDYYSEMPLIFRDSRINLCPSLRCIGTGIPLRALDIMACHGLVLLPASEEAYEYLSNGTDCLIYSSYDEAFELMKYYAAHDTEADAIRQKAFEKASNEFSMEHRLQQIEKAITD
ncbi:MAG: DUF3880 domain-containing protein [Lachnospiraceae bacterium]|nr:DUF3880 domain-containing protein [Lachnospiraceae bacterium]